MTRRSRKRRGRRPSPRSAHDLVAPILTGNHSDQNGCPLFSLIPPELRHEIFVLALTSYDDETRPFPPTAYYISRKGYRYYQCIHTALLATCRRIYSETHDLPISLNEHVLWFYRGPQGLINSRAYFLGFTPKQRDAVQRIHIFTELYYLRNDFAWGCAFREMRPKHLKIIIRHSDWWWWGQNERLRMKNPFWGTNLKMKQSLESLEIEMETMERDKDQVCILFGLFALI